MVPTVEAALQGARDLIAERVNDDADTRARIRRLFWARGILRSEVRSAKAEVGAKYADYFDWSEPIARAPSHRVLAILRGETEEILSCVVQPPEQEAITILDGLFVRGSSRSSEQVRLAVRDGYKRLLARAMETRGFTVTTAETVADGLLQLETCLPAFAVVDMRLAGRPVGRGR